MAVDLKWILIFNVICLMKCSSSVYLRFRPIYKHNQLQFRYSYKENFYTQKVDHFGFLNSDTFQQRYLISDTYWNKNGGPIFFYTGNEGDISWFCNNTGFMWDIAPEFKAMIVFAEHRYYGKSIPYGPTAYKDPSKMNYLTSEQALADFAVLIEHIKSVIPGAKSSKVITFGGSYGGMLSGWFRMKYPNVVAGALAASAPMWSFRRQADCGALSQTITHTFNITTPMCVQNIQKMWSTLNSIAKEASGLSYLSQTFHLCHLLKTLDDFDKLKSWITETFADIAMVDYPYPSNFLEPLPSWPVKEACKPLSVALSGKTLIEGMVKFLNVYYNFTGTTKCFDIGQEATPDLGVTGWDYQSCTEMVMPSCSNGVTDMFEESKWDFDAYVENCKKTWKVTPDLDWIQTHYWGKNIQYASNIIFSNGLLDPWSSGGVLKSLSDSLVAIVIKNGAHHLDLRSSNKGDTQDVITARQQEKEIITKWLHSEDEV